MERKKRRKKDKKFECKANGGRDTRSSALRSERDTRKKPCVVNSVMTMVQNETNGGLFIDETQTVNTDKQIHGKENSNATDNMDTVEKTNRIRQYPEGHKGPFIVYVRAKDGKGLKQMAVSKLIFDSCKPGVDRIDQVNAFKMRVVFKTAQAANQAPLMQCLEPYRVYIPASEVEVDGVIRLEPSEDEKDLEKFGRGVFDNIGLSEVKVLEAYRVGRKQGNDVIQTRVVRVTFPGKVLPDKVVLDGLRIPVRLYRPLEMVCTRCQRTGHTEKLCVSRPRCMKCGETHLTKDCSETNDAAAVCVRCKQTHEAGRSKCPKVIAADERRLQKARQRYKTSYAEAAKETRNENRYSTLSESEEEEFPDLVAPGTKRLRSHNKGPHVQKRARPGPEAETGTRRKVATERHGDKKKQPNGIGFQKDRDNMNKEGEESFMHMIRALVLEVVESLKLPEPFTRVAVTFVSTFFDKFAPILIARCSEAMQDA